MGPDSSSGPVVEYIDGQPVEIGHPLPEITPDYTAGGVTVEEATAAAERLAAAMGGIGMTIEVAAEGLRAFANSMEVAMAMHLVLLFPAGGPPGHVIQDPKPAAATLRTGDFLAPPAGGFHGLAPCLQDHGAGTEKTAGN